MSLLLEPKPLFFINTCVSNHVVMALLCKVGVYKQPESLAFCRLERVRLIPECFAKNTEFQSADWVTAHLS